VSQSADDVEDEGQHRAQKQRSCEWEIENCVLPAIEDIARQTAEGKTGAPDEQEDSSQYKQQHAKKDKDFAELCHANIVLCSAGLGSRNSSRL
jgi:hypothetical protein